LADLDGGRFCAEQLLGASEQGVDVGRSEQSVVSDLDETVGQNVEEEAADELVGGDRAGGIATGAKDDEIVTDVEQAGVGDGDAVGVEAEVANNLLGATEGSLGIDQPGPWQVGQWRLRQESCRTTSAAQCWQR
jgi:hypothetical protein